MVDQGERSGARRAGKFFVGLAAAGAVLGLALWEFAPSMDGQGAMPREAAGDGQGEGNAPLSLGGSSAARGGSSAETAGGADSVPAETEPRGEEKPSESVASGAPLGRVLRVLSEVDAEPVESAKVRFFGLTRGDTTTKAATKNGYVQLPGAVTRRCRVTAEGFVPKNMSLAGVPLDRPLEVVLRPYAVLFGKIETVLPETMADPDLAAYERRKRRRSPGDSAESSAESSSPRGYVVVVADPTLPYVEGEQSNYRGILTCLREMEDGERRVRDDGTWELRLEIPPEIDDLHELVVEQRRGSSRRVVQSVSIVRPGDRLELLDSWADLAPSSIRVEQSDGAPPSPRLAVELRQERGGYQDTVGPLLVDAAGELPQLALPPGQWLYTVQTHGLPESVQVGGTFTHRRAEPHVLRLPPGRPLTVKLVPKEPRSNSRVRVGLAPAGQVPRRVRHFLRAGMDVVFPFVPEGTPWDVVVLGNSRRRTKGAKDAGVLDRVPLASTQDAAGAVIEIVVD